MTIREMCARAQATSVAKGFVTEGDPRIDQKLMLTVGELVEAQNELRNGHLPQFIYTVVVPDGPKPEGFPIELADAVIRIGQLAEHLGIDLEAAIKLKMDYNDTRPFMHGKKF